MELFDLAYSSRMYETFTSFNESFLDLRQSTNGELNLSMAVHRHALILWRNKWGCRQFAIEYHDLASKEILEWSNNLPSGYRDLDLWNLTAYQMQIIVTLYNDLLKRTASYKQRGKNLLTVTFGPTGASKALYALWPKVAVPWDEAMRAHFRREGNGESYQRLLKVVIKEIESLKVSCEKNSVNLKDVPGLLGREEATIPQLVGEHLRVTIARKCLPPSDAIVRNWAKWKGVLEE